MHRVKFPGIHYYNQDFVDIYSKSWYWLKDDYRKSMKREMSFTEALMSSFFLAYNITGDLTTELLDSFYHLQREDGYIPAHITIEGKESVVVEAPAGEATLSFPVLGWVEFNLFHKRGDKKRIALVLPILENYFSWLENEYKDEEVGLYRTPAHLLGDWGIGREDVEFMVDFNAQVAVNLLYMSKLADLQNDKELSFKLMKSYFALKTRINTLMWDDEINNYCDLKANKERKIKNYLGIYWVLLAEIASHEQSEEMIAVLHDETQFFSKHPLPSLALNDEDFDVHKPGYNGAVYPLLNFIVIKGLERYGWYEFAREIAIKHIYSMIDIYHVEDTHRSGVLWDAYEPENIVPALFSEEYASNRKLCLRDKKYVHSACLSTITLMIEEVIGLNISLPRKTVDCFMPTMELMGIEGLSLKRNRISILTNNTMRGWEIRLESEKLYYFTIEIVDEKIHKTLPIPSGNCSILIDKL